MHTTRVDHNCTIYIEMYLCIHINVELKYNTTRLAVEDFDTILMDAFRTFPHLTDKFFYSNIQNLA